MKKINNTLIFTIITFVLLIVPFCKWMKYMDVLYTGVEVEYEIGGYDPINYFKGNYVNLSYNWAVRELYAYMECDEKENRSDAYIVFDEDGKIKDVTSEKPKEPYYLVGWASKIYYYDEFENEDREIIYGQETPDTQVMSVYFDLPTEYYTNAEEAKKLEEELREDSNDFKVVLRIKNGTAIITRLYK